VSTGSKSQHRTGVFSEKRDESMSRYRSGFGNEHGSEAVAGGHGPDAESFEKGSARSQTEPDYVRDTVAFMFASGRGSGRRAWRAMRLRRSEAATKAGRISRSISARADIDGAALFVKRDNHDCTERNS